MLKIWSMKQKQQQDEQKDAAAGTRKKKVTAAQLRVQKGISQDMTHPDSLLASLSS